MKFGVTAALGAIGALVAGLLIVLRKGPVAGLLMILAASVAVFVVAVIEAVVRRKNG